MQKLLTLIITAAIIYMIFKQNVNSVIPPQYLQPNNIPNNNEKSLHLRDNLQPKQELSGNFLEKTLSTMLINVLKTDEGRMFVESLLQPMNKSVAGSGGTFSMNSSSFINSIFKINTFNDGNEGPAACGQIVTIHYKILSRNNIVLEDKTATFPLGSGKIAPGLDAVIVGMKTGQTRHATITNKYMQGTSKDKLSSFKVNILLKSIIPKNFIGKEVKIFDDQLAYRIPLVCANKAIYDTKITKLSNGEVIYDSVALGKKINMTIGNLHYPAIFSYALHNKIPVGKRTVIAPGKLFKSYASDNSIIFPQTTLPENEYFMIEFFNFDESILTDKTTFLVK